MNIKTDYSWSTHQPLILALMAKFSPRYVMELGIGMFSTPMFFKFDFDKYIGIDNDKAWLDHIKSIQQFDDKCELRHHDLGDAINIATFIRQLNEEQKDVIKKYYVELFNEIKKDKTSPKILFVDNFTCCRTPAINVLYSLFDIVIFHDSEPPAYSWYEYYFDENIMKTYNKYNLQTPTSWTTCFINKNFDNNFEELQRLVYENVASYCRSNNISTNGFVFAKE